MLFLNYVSNIIFFIHYLQDVLKRLLHNVNQKNVRKLENIKSMIPSVSDLTYEIKKKIILLIYIQKFDWKMFQSNGVVESLKEWLS